LTEDPRDTELRRYLRDRIVSAALQLRNRGVSFFPLEPDRHTESYWSERPRNEGYIFEIGDNLSSELRALWGEYPEMQSLADELAALARAMADEGEDQADVSSFIYAMF
jgi:hypothetical protein